jgi:hypothetical protein
MKAEVFDDWKSIIHAVVGGLSYFFPLSLSYSFSTRLQSTLSNMNVSCSLLGIFWSSLQVSRLSDYFVSFSD